MFLFCSRSTVSVLGLENVEEQEELQCIYAFKSTFGHKKLALKNRGGRNDGKRGEHKFTKCLRGRFASHRSPKQLAFIFYCFLFIFIIAHGAIFKSMISFNKTLIFSPRVMKPILNIVVTYNLLVVTSRDGVSRALASCVSLEEHIRRSEGDPGGSIRGIIGSRTTFRKLLNLPNAIRLELDSKSSWSG
jgi:hypothetical protein